MVRILSGLHELGAKNLVSGAFNREKSLFFNFLTYGIVVLEGSYAIYLVYELNPYL